MKGRGLVAMFLNICKQINSDSGIEFLLGYRVKVIRVVSIIRLNR